MLNTQFILDNGTYFIKVDPAKLEVTRRWLIDNHCKFSFKTIRGGYTVFSIKFMPSAAVAAVEARYTLFSKQPIKAPKIDIVGGVVIENPASKFAWL